LRTAVLVFALAILLVVPYSAASDEGTQLFGTVGPGFTIVLVDGAGKRVTHLDPGTYTVRVDDLSAGHNFHLYGPGVDEATDILGVGETSWTLVFHPGAYVFQCDIHVGEMSGGFDVGNIPATTTTRTTTTVPPPRPAPVGRLVASVADGRISLSARAARRGSYRLLVRDASHTDNFHLSGPGVNRRTSIRGTGTVTWNVRLVRGSYAFGSDSRSRPAGLLVVR